ncbi:hypothetical protein BH24ACT15_BH24ACT15_08500 [soil metagenome]
MTRCHRSPRRTTAPQRTTDTLGGFTDRDGAAVSVPDPPAGGSHYGSIGAFQGQTYGRNAFAQYTAQEADVLVRALDLRHDDRILDVGCGNGRHVARLRELGYDATGVDLSPEVLAGGVSGLAAARAQHLPFATASVDGVFCVCQGGFGISVPKDRQAVSEWSRVLRTGGRLALTAFSLVFAARYMAEGDTIDVARGLHHHLAEVAGPDGQHRRFDLWTAAYSVPHLRQMLADEGLRVLGIAGVEPGGYQLQRPPGTADPEVLVWAERI